MKLGALNLLRRASRRQGLPPGQTKLRWPHEIFFGGRCLFTDKRDPGLGDFARR